MARLSNDLLGTTLKARVMIHNIRYPSAGHSSGDWAIVVFDLLKVLEGEAIDDHQITCVGNMPKLREGAFYVIDGKLVKNYRLDDSPETGDQSFSVYYVYSILLVAIGLILILYRKKRY